MTRFNHGSFKFNYNLSIYLCLFHSFIHTTLYGLMNSTSYGTNTRTRHWIIIILFYFVEQLLSHLPRFNGIYYLATLIGKNSLCSLLLFILFPRRSSRIKHKYISMCVRVDEETNEWNAKKIKSNRKRQFFSICDYLLCNDERFKVNCKLILTLWTWHREKNIRVIIIIMWNGYDDDEYEYSEGRSPTTTVREWVERV